MTQNLPTPDVVPSTAIPIARGVHIIPDCGVPLVPNIGLIEGQDAVLVVDCGMGPANGKRVFDWAQTIAKGRRIYLTLTHFHPEHSFGASAFTGQAEIIVNSLQAEEAADKAEAYLQMFRGFGPHVAAALEGTRLVPPVRIYRGSLELDLGGRSVRLEEIGPAHTGGDQIIWLEQERILFTGDLAEEGMFPIFPWFPGQDTDLDAGRWEAALRTLVARGPMTVIPGHGAVSDESLLTILAGYMQDMRGLSGDLGTELHIPAIETHFTERHPEWQGKEWIGFAARHYRDVARSRP
jgi:glyoxylase-like metal-dependent hydrolase (beta-lactamase superfamily II)